MWSERKFVFSDDSDSLEVLIPEIAEPQYGMYTWPCAPVLAQFMWFNRDKFKDKTILELGAGTSLPGIVAAKCGACVHLSDSANFPKCLDSSRKSCDANGLHNMPVHSITWGKLEGDILTHEDLDLVIASDCFYDNTDFEDIIVTVAYLLQHHQGAEFLCAYQERSASRSIANLLAKWKLNASLIELSSFNGHSIHLAGSTLPGNHTVTMFKITPAST